ncbi:hypothetical protein AMECASPLE_033083 [Ameca splendens]|uniref:Uncharacterized protein n=1 Tax=Ameca splendens TaxID=208324 RepID=A0ABV0XJS0_9TELE
MWPAGRKMPRSAVEGVELVPCSTTGKKTTLLLLKPSFDHRPDSSLQHPGISLPSEAEESDPPVVGTNPPNLNQPGKLATIKLFHRLCDLSLGDERVQHRVSAPTREGVMAGLRRSLKYSFHRPLMSPFEVSSSTTPL